MKAWPKENYGGKNKCAMSASARTGYEIRMGNQSNRMESCFQRFGDCHLEKGERQILGQPTGGNMSLKKKLHLIKCKSSPSTGMAKE